MARRLEVLFYLDVPYTLESVEHPSFLPGRAGRIMAQGRCLGLIGELHPEVLERWQIGMPVVVIEVELGALAK